MISRTKILFIAGLFIIAAGCKKSFYDINDNPNAVTEEKVTSELVLPYALHNAGEMSIYYGWLNNWMGYWSNSGSFAPNSEETTYNITGSFSETNWSFIYNMLYDFHVVEQKAPGEGKHFYAGIAKVIKAKFFQDLVDLYGNIPYTEAFNKEHPAPAYDEAAFIYSDLQTVLDSAIYIFNNYPVPAAAATYDIVYQGDENLWIRFANSIKLRLLIRQSEVPGFNPAPEIAKIVSEGGVLQSGETADVNPGYVNEDGKQNPFYATYGYNAIGNDASPNTRANAFFVSLLKSNNDPRLSRFFRPATSPTNPSNQYVGTVYGSAPDDNFNGAKTSKIGPGLTESATQSQWIFTSVESLFLLAEAVTRGWISGSDQQAYENAVRESFIWLGVPSAVSAANTYMANNPDANWSNTTNLQSKLEMLITEKYIAMAGINPLEAWSDYRRLGIPSNIPLSANPARTSTLIPIRLLYPTREFAVNATNVQAQGSINQFTTRIFWDL